MEESILSRSPSKRRICNENVEGGVHQYPCICKYYIQPMCDRLSNVFVKAALFSGVVATFLALSIPDLQDQKGFHTSSFAVNILWLLSLVFSIGSAFFASKVQEWTETYQKTEYQTTGAQTTETHLIPEAHQTTRSGPSRETSPPLPKFLEYWIAFLDYFSALLIVLTLEIMRQSLEIAVFFFFLGLIIYVWNISTIAGPFVLAFVCLFFGFYSLVGSAIRIRQVLEVYHNN